MMLYLGRYHKSYKGYDMQISILHGTYDDTQLVLDAAGDIQSRYQDCDVLITSSYSDIVKPIVYTPELSIPDLEALQTKLLYLEGVITNEVIGYMLFSDDEIKRLVDDKLIPEEVKDEFITKEDIKGLMDDISIN